MRRIAAIVILASTAMTSAALARKPPPKPLTCEKTSERFSARQAEWATFTSKSFTAALAREQLAIPKLTQRTLPADDKLLEHVKPGTTFKMGTGLALFERTVQSYNYTTDEYVQDAQGVIHPLVRHENVVGIETHTLCGCGDMGGGAVPPELAIIYVMPAGATYDKTPIALAYDAKHIEIQYRNIVDGKEVICQPPP